MYSFKKIKLIHIIKKASYLSVIFYNALKSIQSESISYNPSVTAAIPEFGFVCLIYLIVYSYASKFKCGTIFIFLVEIPAASVMQL